MDAKPVDRVELEAELQRITQAGIKANDQRVKADMVHQWENWRFYARELVVNACDAHARVCRISATEQDGKTTVVVEDDGHGMNRQGMRDFMKVFRSRKVRDDLTVGQHGIGRLSIAAIPGQCGFKLRTSNDSEAWQMVTGYLLGDQPITIERIEPVGPHGTRIEVTFERQLPLHEELASLRDVLATCTRFIPMSIVIYLRRKDDPDGREEPCWIHAEWTSPPERFARSYSCDLQRQACEVVFGLGAAVHEVYQNRVLITATRYNLLSHDLPSALYVPHLTIRVDSRAFLLPFGRHCLRNESDVLPELARHLRTQLLPRYFAELAAAYGAGTLPDYEVSYGDVESIACALMAYDPSPQRAWSRLPVFVTRNRGRLSLADLRDFVGAKGWLYIEGEDATDGVDYAAFDVPVLARSQPVGGLELLQRLYRSQLINLAAEDVAIEPPPGSGPVPGARERRLEEYLHFSPQAVRAAARQADADQADSAPVDAGRIQRLVGLCEEARLAAHDVSRLDWRVNYLVGRDGRTPCTTHRFVLKNDSVVILNLHHPEVQNLVTLAERNAPLAGHFGLAACLADSGRLLRQLTPEAREDLLVADAMAKCGQRQPRAATAEATPRPSWRERDFLRDATDEQFGLAF